MWGWFNRRRAFISLLASFSAEDAFFLTIVLIATRPEGPSASHTVPSVLSLWVFPNWYFALIFKFSKSIVSLQRHRLSSYFFLWFSGCFRTLLRTVSKIDEGTEPSFRSSYEPATSEGNPGTDCWGPGVSLLTLSIPLLFGGPFPLFSELFILSLPRRLAKTRIN